MTIEEQKSMHDERSETKAEERVDEESVANKVTLELCFIVVVGLFVAAAFISALSYDLVSARAPLFIMVPLLILIGGHVIRVKTASRNIDVVSILLLVVRGENPNFNIVAGFVGWMVLLLALITVAGHYVGIAALMFIMLRIVSKEKMLLSLAITTGVTLMIFILFELGFDIELHRGAIYRIWAGDADY